MANDEKLERRKWEVQLEFAYRKAEKKLQSFPVNDNKKVEKLLFDFFEKRQKNPKLEKNNIWDARCRVREGKATKQDKELLKKCSVGIKNFNKILDAWNHFSQLSVLFQFQEKGADLLESASVLGKIFDEKFDAEEADKKIKHLLRKRKTMN